MIKKYKYLISTVFIVLLFITYFIVVNTKDRSVNITISLRDIENNSEYFGNTLSIYNKNDTIYLDKIEAKSIGRFEKQSLLGNSIPIDSLIQLYSNNSDYFINKPGSNKKEVIVKIIKPSVNGKNDSVLITKPILLISRHSIQD